MIAFMFTVESIPSFPIESLRIELCALHSLTFIERWAMSFILQENSPKRSAPHEGNHPAACIDYISLTKTIGNNDQTISNKENIDNYNQQQWQQLCSTCPLHWQPCVAHTVFSYTNLKHPKKKFVNVLNCVYNMGGVIKKLLRA